MAENNPYANIGTLSPDQFQQQQELNRQQRMAEMLSQNNQQPQGQMIGNRFVAPSWAAQLAPAVNMIAGAYLGKKADEKALEYAKQLREQKMGVLENINAALDTGDLKKARSIATANPEFAGQFAAPLIANAIPKTPESVAEYNAAKADGFKGSFTDYKNKMNDYQKEELKISAGRLAVDQAKAAFEMQNGKPLNESQGKAAVFHSQMVGASNELNNLYSKGFNPNKPQSQVTTGMAGGAFNFLTPAAAQQAKQAQNQWTEAYLRFKTGAGTNAHEIEANRKTYFPDFGDQPDAIAQKARMREQAQNDIAMAAGPQGARMGVQSNPIAPISSNQPAQQITPSLWGPATVVK